MKKIVIAAVVTAKKILISNSNDIDSDQDNKATVMTARREDNKYQQ